MLGNDGKTRLLRKECRVIRQSSQNRRHKTVTTSRAILQGGRNSAKKRIWVYEPEKKNIYGHLQFNLILVIKRLGHGVGRVDEYGSNGTEYRASETLIKATDKDGQEGADECGVSSAPFGTRGNATPSENTSIGHATESHHRRCRRISRFIGTFRHSRQCNPVSRCL